MQNALKLSVAGIVAIVFAAVAVSQQQNNVPQQDAEYSAQTQSAENIFQADSVSAEPSEADFNRYNEGYCEGEVRLAYQMLQQGYGMPAKAEQILRSEMKKCEVVQAAYEKKYPPGTMHTVIIANPLAGMR